MYPLELQPGGRKALLAPLPAKGDGVVAMGNPLGELPLPAEWHDLRPESFRTGRNERVIHIKNCEVVCSLILEDPDLGVDVIPEGGVTVQMILGDIEQDRHPRAESPDPFQLERAELDNHPCRLFSRGDEFDQGIADISADERSKAAGTEDFSG